MTLQEIKELAESIFRNYNLYIKDGYSDKKFIPDEFHSGKPVDITRFKKCLYIRIDISKFYGSMIVDKYELSDDINGISDFFSEVKKFCSKFPNKKYIRMHIKSVYIYVFEDVKNFIKFSSL